MYSICHNSCAKKHKNILKYLQKKSKIKPFSNQYNWKEVNFPSHKNEWKKFESNNKSITLNTLYVPCNPEEIRHAYISKDNRARKN